MKALITGRPGTGKSYITQALQERGFNAYDLEDVPGAVGLEVKATGEAAKWPAGFVDWGYYAWNIREKPLLDLLAAQGDKDVFVSVSATNQDRFYALFDVLFALTVDDPTELRHRLENRDVHEFGQGPENIQNGIDRYPAKTAQYLAEGCIPIDNTRPVETVVNDLVRLLRQEK